MRVAVVGGGPTGLTAALAFAQQGAEVDLFERLNEPHPGLWVVLGHTAITVAQELGFWQELRSSLEQIGCLPIANYVFVDGTVSVENSLGSLIRSHDMNARYGRDIGWVIPREPLQNLLEMRVAATQKIRVVKHSCTSVDIASGIVACDENKSGPYDLIVGADGTFSTVRKYVVPSFQLAEQEITFQGIARIPPHEKEAFGLRFKNHLHNFVIGLHTTCPFVVGRLTDTSFAYLVALPPALVEAVLLKEGQPATATWQGSRRVSAERWKALLLAEVTHLLLRDLIIRTGSEDFRPIRLRLANPLPLCSHKDRLVMIGDAMHTNFPSTGWGLSLGMSDALALARLCGAELNGLSPKEQGQARNGVRPLDASLQSFDRQQRPLWEAFLQQSLLSSTHFGRKSLFLDRIVLTLLPTKLFLGNYDKVCSPVTEGNTIRPLWNKYAAAVALLLIGLSSLLWQLALRSM